MTTDERARAIVLNIVNWAEQWVLAADRPQRDMKIVDEKRRKFMASLDAIAAALRAERSQCQRVATDYGRDVPGGRMYADRIAGLIGDQP